MLKGLDGNLHRCLTLAMTMKKGQKSTKPNPFDLKVTKPKCDVLNRDKRGIKGAPGKAKIKNMEIRTATLLPELARRAKTSAFVDRRFGERDRNMTQEEKMLERFAKERKRKANLPGLGKKKRSIFNLDADEEYGGESLASLTHLGQDVDDIEEFSDPEEGQFAHEKGFIDKKAVKRGHFGGFASDAESEEVEAEQVPKTKAEIMKEVIAKSKFYKAERQKIKEENEELCNELDQDFDRFRSKLMAEKYDRAAEPKVEDDYDSIMKKMMFDKRSKPTDRTLTAEEAQKKREQAEEAREARMQGRRLQDEDESDTEETEAKKEIKSSDTEKEESRVRDLLDQFCNAESVEAANIPFKTLVEMSAGPASVALGRAIRSQLAKILSRFKMDRRPFLPSKVTLMLFHFIGLVYSTSDFHHVIATPAQLLMTAFLEGGRMTRPRHVISALFITQTLLHYQRQSKRVFPEIFNFLNLMTRYLFDAKNVLSYNGIYNRLIEDRLKAALCGSKSSSLVPVKLGFDDLAIDSKEFTPELARIILGSTIYLIKRAGELYCECPSFPEYLGPLLSAAESAPQSSSLSTLSLIHKSASSRRKALTLQHHKPIALPMLNPDLGGDEKEVRETTRLKAACKREFKGAKREIRRDNEFLARHEATERKRKDQDYKQMINRVIGTIANDNGSSKKQRKR